ncbi:MAG: hypothetical protein LQ344_003032 [Seirophora lacunosa]|nr:MAG: hypothetical protein LQ344_003032 [Seirophora lacunosa]
MEPLNLLDCFDYEIAGLKDGGWATTPLAALAARFQKTIVLDVDAFFPQSLDQLFEIEPGLMETRTLSVLEGRQPSAVFNQDLLRQYGAYQEMDSVTVCIDKGRLNVFISLLFAAWMNAKRVREELTYQHIHGDKGTLWLASEISGSPRYFHPFYAAIIGVPKPLTTPDSSVNQAEPRSQPQLPPFI